MDFKAYEQAFEPHILERGRAYFAEGAVKNLRRDGGDYVARVQGSDAYDVHLSAQSLDDSDCSCPHLADGNLCKHLAAVLYAAWEATGADGQGRA